MQCCGVVAAEPRPLRESRRPRVTKVLSVGQPLTQQALKLGDDALRCVPKLALPFRVRG